MLKVESIRDYGRGIMPRTPGGSLRRSRTSLLLRTIGSRAEAELIEKTVTLPPGHPTSD